MKTLQVLKALLFFYLSYNISNIKQTNSFAILILNLKLILIISCFNFDLKVLSVLLLTAAAANGQSYHIGSCPKSVLQEDFNITKVKC